MAKVRSRLLSYFVTSENISHPQIIYCFYCTFCTPIPVGHTLPRTCKGLSAIQITLTNALSALPLLFTFLVYHQNTGIMRSTRAIKSNTIGNNARIYQADVIQNYASKPSEPCVLIPFPRNEELISRQDLISELDRILPLSEDYSTAALYGLGGSG